MIAVAKPNDPSETGSSQQQIRSSVGEVFDIQQGKALSARARLAKDRYPFLRTTNVLWNRIDTNTVDQMGLSPEERVRLALASGDLLVCEGGEIGRAAVWHGEVP